jgi:hypothetical protein
MNEQVAHALIDAELRQYQRLSYSDLTALTGKVETKELVGEDGKTYYLEIQVFWDSKKDADVRLIVAADDGGWRAYKPLTGDFMMRPRWFAGLSIRRLASRSNPSRMNRGWIASAEALPHIDAVGLPLPLSFAAGIEPVSPYLASRHGAQIASNPPARESSSE